MDHKFLFITGRGRSGTWLLQSILNHHNKISVAPESIFIAQLSSRYKSISHWTDKHIDCFVKDLQKDQKLCDWWQLDYDELKLKLKEVQNLNFQKACLTVYSQYAIQQNRVSLSYLGDKNPEYSLKLDELMKLFPRAKIIIMVRDPRDNISSYKNVNFDLSNSYALAARWNYYASHINRFKDNESVFIIKFEDLVLSPKQTLIKICDFLHIEFSDELLNFYKHSKNVFSWNEKISSKISADNVYKWKRTEDQDITKISYLCKEYIQNFSYELGEIKVPGILDRLNYMFGMYINYLEVMYYRLPLSIKQLILKLYRKKTKTFE